MEQDATRWPEWFPAKCPPRDATRADGHVYRLVSTTPPTSADFVPYARDPDKQVREHDRCKACGLSVYREYRDALQITNVVPSMRGMIVTKALLDMKMGKLKPTPSRGNSHHTWWSPHAFEAERLPWTAVTSS